MQKILSFFLTLMTTVVSLANPVDDILERIDAENPALALLERQNTYLMEGKNKVFLTYMREHYGDNIYLRYVGKINKKNAYQLIRVG